MDKARLNAWLVPVIALGLAFGLAFPSAARAELTVVASVPDLAALAHEIGGGHAKVSSLALSTQDPHFVDARPHLALTLNRADLVLVVGLELESGWLPTLLVGARNPRIQPGARGYLDASSAVRRLEVPTVAVDRSMGHVHGGGNPHYLCDPRAAAAVAAVIAERMQELDPAHASAYRNNAAALLARLTRARVDWEQRFARHRGAPIVAFHKTTAYLADWLGLEQVAFLEPKPGIPPTPAHVARVLGIARKRGVRAVLQEEYYPDTTSRLFASKVPAGLVRLPGGTRFERGESYLQHLERMAGALLAALEKGAEANR